MNKTTLFYSIAFVLASFFSYSEQVKAQLNQLKTNNLPKEEQIDFKQPDYSGDAPSGRERGTGSRGDCSIADSSQKPKLTLTPLIPSDSRGLTINESPTVWIYVSYKSGTANKEISGEFSLEDTRTNRKVIPKNIAVTLPTTSGFFSIPIVQALEINNWYRWYLSVECNSEEFSSNNSVLSVQGMVKQVNLPEPKNKLEKEELITFYSKAGIWYDTLNEAASLYCGNPNNDVLAKLWTPLLQDDLVQLDAISQEPLSCK